MIAIDTRVLVGLLDDRDNWHPIAGAIGDALDRANVETVYFDCVLNEAISVLARRTGEQRRPEQLDALLCQLVILVPESDITWISRDIQRLYNQVVDLVHSSTGSLNFHDALIALICRERNIATIASFDRDFDQISWLTRVGNAEDLQAVIQQNATTSLSDEEKS